MSWFEILPFLVWILLVLILWGTFFGLHIAVRGVAIRVSRRVAAWISESEWRTRRFSPILSRLAPFSIVILIVVVATGALLAGIDWFFDIAELVDQESEVVARIDAWAHGRTGSTRPDQLIPFFMTMAVIGNPGGLSIILLGGVLIALYRRSWWLAAWGVLTAASGGLVNRVLKNLYARERPDLFQALGDAPGFSFPSGHTMGSVIVLGVLAWITVRLTDSRKVESFAIAVAIAGALAISASRVFLGVHWLTDIAAGLSAGMAWLALAIVLYESVRRVRTIRRSLGRPVMKGEE